MLEIQSSAAACGASTMASIEDLLQSDDSDDEEDPNVDIDDVDLEQLLNSKDDDEDDVDAYAALKALAKPKTSPIPNILKREPSKSSNASEGSDPAEDEQLEELIKNIKFPRNDSIISESVELLEQDIEQGAADGGEGPGDEMDSLKLAEAREQRELLHTDKPAPSALQLRRQTSPSDPNGATLLHIESLPMISAQLKRNLSYQLHGPGTGTAFSICSKYFAIGTNKGYIIIFDHKQEIRRVLNSCQMVVLKSPAIGALDSLSDGSLIVSGHQGGEVLFWDTAKGTILKQFHDPSNADVLGIQFIHSIAAGDLKCNANLMDSDSFHLLVWTGNNTLNRYKLTKTLLSNWHVDIECLLDGTKDSIAAMAALSPHAVSPAPSDAMIGTTCYDIKQFGSMLQVFAFALNHMTVVVQVLPEVKIIHRWNTGSEEAPVPANTLQLLEWNWALLPIAEESIKSTHSPVLTRAVGNLIEIQSLHVQHTKAPKPVQSTRASILRFTPFNNEEVVQQISYSFSPLASAHLPGRVWAMRWIGDQLIAIGDQEVWLLDQRLVVLEKISLLPDIKQAVLTNSLPRATVHGNRMHLLLPGELNIVTTRSPLEQVNILISNGKYIEGLGLIIDNITKSPSLLVSEEANIKRYILNYALLAVKRMESSATSKAKSSNHLYLVASVCIEYCISTKNVDLLYYDILDIFRTEGNQNILLESLEGFILNNSITTLPASIISDFLQLALTNGKYKTIERCILYFDLYTLDMHFICQFLFSCRMYSSFLYVYGNGLSDYCNAFGLVFTIVDDDLDNADVGYKLLLFVCYLFEEKLFPRGLPKFYDVGIISGVLDYMLSEKIQPVSPLSGQSPQPLKTQRFPYLSYFAKLDALALFHVLAKGFEKQYNLLHVKKASNVSEEYGKMSTNISQLLQFAVYLDKQPQSTVRYENIMFDKMSSLLVSMHNVSYSPQVLHALVRYFAGKPLSLRSMQEQQLTSLAENQSKNKESLVELFNVLVANNYFLSALALATRSAHLLPCDAKIAIGFYFALDQPLLFDFIDAYQAYLEKHQAADARGVLNKEIITKMVDMAMRDLKATVRLILKHLLGQMSYLIEQTKYDNKVQFLILSSLIAEHHKQEEEGSAKYNGLDAANGLFDHFQHADMVYFLHLHALFKPSELLQFIQTYSSHIPLDDAMQIAKEHYIHDCVSYLHEKCGDVLTALQVLLKDISAKIRSGRREVDTLLRQESTKTKGVSIKAYISSILSKGLPDIASLLLQIPCLSSLTHMLDCALALCSRQLAAYTNSNQAGGEAGKAQVSAFFCDTFDHILQERRKPNASACPLSLIR